MTDWPGRQTVCGLDELATHCDAGITRILSILDPDTPDPEIFTAYAPHQRLVLRFHDILEPEPDLVAPRSDHVEALLDFGRRAGEDASEHVLIHCHMGVSRSTAAAVALLLQARPQADDEEAIAQLLRIRPQAWPNARMIAFTDALLGRGGRLTAALDRFQRSRELVRSALG